MLDLVIIGAGPAGLAAAREAKARGLDFVVLEKGLIANTIYEYPIGKPLFSTPGELELAPGGIRHRGEKPTREELLSHYTRFAVDAGLPVRTEEPALAIERDGDGFAVETREGRYRSRIVLVATGINGIRKRLGVPGESDERVRYRFVEAFPYAGKRVLVVGSGNSAAETALFLEEVGAHVTLAMRRAGFAQDPVTGKAEIKWWVREPLERLVGEARMTIHFDATVVEIGPESAALESPRLGRISVACDTVFALLGTAPDLGLLAAAGVAVDDEGVPVYDDATFETNVPGLYVLGHITRERHVKGALAAAPRVVARIAGALAEAPSTV